MSGQYSNEPMLDMYIFETAQNIEQLEDLILSSEKSSCYTLNAINEIFRIMHTIKGSSAMMLFNNISRLAHAVEDLFYFIREDQPKDYDCSTLSDLVLEGVDFIKVELEKIKNGDNVDGNAAVIIEEIKVFLSILKQVHSDGDIKETKEEKASSKQQYYIAQKVSGNLPRKAYKAVIWFEDGCELENIRAYSVVQDLKELTQELHFYPEDIIDNDDTIQVIRQNGFTLNMKINKSYDELLTILKRTVFLKDLELTEVNDSNENSRQDIKPEKLVIQESPVKVPPTQSPANTEQGGGVTSLNTSVNQSIISVNINKLDKLMDLVGEMVIAEAMVTQNPDLEGLEIDNFNKAARQLHKITSEIQDMVMSIRMVPLDTTFHKMQRIVRDMSKKLGKDVQLQLIGEETEVDKNIIEHISDPLMHLVRNAIDHGIEQEQERAAKGKPNIGTVTLEAKNAGSDVLVTIRDDGRGLSKEKILQKAREHGLLTKNENELTDKEIYNLILVPGFSTKEAISEFSGRGVGMDVVTKNLEKVGGTVSIESIEGTGSLITLKIPLTLAIIDGMNVRVGSSRYTIPIISIKESFRPRETDLIRDPDENEMIMVRGKCYPILRLHEHFGVKTDVTGFTDGILIMVEQDEKTLCIFADELIGQQQVVVKALPGYIKKGRNIQGLAGCTLLGDGSISLILDIAGLFG